MPGRGKVSVWTPGKVGVLTETIGTSNSTETTSAARTLAIYRSRLAELLVRAETAAQNGDAEIHFTVSTLVDRLSGDLMRLYDESQRGVLTQSDRTIVLPALEFMREVLRHAWSRPRALRDTLCKALAAVPDGSS
jgi:hypothetical protein